jgi:hypothetical protein
MIIGQCAGCQCWIKHNQPYLSDDEKIFCSQNCALDWFRRENVDREFDDYFAAVILFKKSLEEK